MGAYTPITLPFRRQRMEDEVEVLLARVERLLACLDAIDGDPDAEEDDPSGDPLDLLGEMPSDDGRPLLPERPLWAVDQEAGPTNYREASRAHQAAEMGLVRSPTGGWRHA